ncbi:MAG TPA: GMC oxidoreductase [Candidatus Dormibacteraeota bacterium]|nr:GMC oxidoreductase [Candidatus Dormibacteraeota bacterium]
MEEKYEALVIGSGFGGAITGCRLAKKWDRGRVLILERGKRYPMGSFPRKPHDFAHNFWALAGEGVRRPRHVRRLIDRGEESHGIFDVRNFHHMDAVVGAGLGGGSLIYANVFMVPPDEVFDERWPGSCKKTKLLPYYAVAKEVLGSRPIPANDDPRRQIIRQQLFAEVAKKNGRNSELVDINVFFGNDFQKPLAIGVQDKNRYGALQTSCVYCAECDIGCNYHAKNTLDLNYLFVAEHRYQAVIRTEHLVLKIVPVDAAQADDPSADGTHGYRIYFRDLTGAQKEVQTALARRVVVSAGALGSTELLLRCKEHFRTLPQISAKLGRGFSGNGDFISFVLGSKLPADPNYGPVITQRTDYNLFKDFDRDRAFMMQDAAYGDILAWFVEGAKPGFLRLDPFRRFLRDLYSRLTTGKSLGALGWALDDLLSKDVSFRACVLLCMGIDKSNGVMTLDGDHQLSINWPYKDSVSLYQAILEAGKQFSKTVQAAVFAPLPTWDWPIRNNVTVHALGGCTLANDSSRGVTSADPETFGQVYGYRNLYVADGAIVPTAVGANPTATISALSEMVAQGITGIAPDADL